jgi:hypothetical protein
MGKVDANYLQEKVKVAGTQIQYAGFAWIHFSGNEIKNSTASIEAVEFLFGICERYYSRKGFQNMS